MRRDGALMRRRSHFQTRIPNLLAGATQRAAAGSGSEARAGAVGSKLHALVRLFILLSYVGRPLPRAQCE